MSIVALNKPVIQQAVRQGARPLPVREIRLADGRPPRFVTLPDGRRVLVQ